MVENMAFEQSFERCEKVSHKSGQRRGLPGGEIRVKASRRAVWLEHGK